MNNSFKWLSCAKGAEAWTSPAGECNGFPQFVLRPLSEWSCPVVFLKPGECPLPVYMWFFGSRKHSLVSRVNYPQWSSPTDPSPPLTLAPREPEEKLGTVDIVSVKHRGWTSLRLVDSSHTYNSVITQELENSSQFGNWSYKFCWGSWNQSWEWAV